MKVAGRGGPAEGDVLVVDALAAAFRGASSSELHEPATTVAMRSPMRRRRISTMVRESADGRLRYVRLMATITADLLDGYVVEVRNGRHRWRADEPVDLGGTETGPTPYEMLLGAVASCTLITLAMYTRRKGMKVDSVSVRYTYERVHADDCDSCPDDLTGYLDRVTSEIVIEGQFTDDERGRLEQVAVRCPVHRTLERGVVFADTVVVR